MIKKLLSGIFVAGILSANAQQVQNPGLETWQNSFPVGWGSFSEMLFAATGTNPGTEVQTATKHTGSLAALLENKFVALASSNIPGGINTGPITFNGGNPKRGRQAYAGQPTSYDFWYQFTATGGDTAATTIYLTKWNTGLGQNDTLASGGSYIIGAAATYTNMIVPINWLMAGVPDSIQLLFTSSIKKVGGAMQPPLGGQLYIDDVTMNNPLGVQTLMADGSFSTYPNPASNLLTISCNNQKAKEAKVYDLTGRNVATYQLTGNLTKADISMLENGVYIYVVHDEESGKIFTAKFSVAK